ncbi:MAG: GNAT family N-acetyltransferase [Bacteroidales bacterium]|nr:GNAT family N-acetyltransferase [Bacteroidales bacterium]
MIQIKVIKSFEETSEIKTKWDFLVKQNNLDISVSYDWSATIWESHLKNKDINVFSIENNGTLLCVMPIVLRRKTIKKIPIDAICCLSDLSNLHNDLLLDRKNENGEVLDIFFNQLKKNKKLRKWDVMEFGSVVVGGTTDQALKKYFYSRNYKYLISIGSLSPFINIKKYSYSWDEYLKSLNKKVKSNFKRKQNKINREGAVEIKRIYDNEMILNIISLIERNSWKHKNGSSIIDKEHQQAFYKSLLKKFNNNFVFFILFFNNDPISYSMGLIDRNKYYSLKTSYIDKFKKLSPGIVLRLSLLQYCFENKFNEFDFCGEDEEWKKDFTSDFREHNHYLIYNKKLFSKFLIYINKIFRDK